MSDALVYLRLGIEHLLDPKGIDHVVFVAALTASYALGDVRRLLLLVTAFTAGHTLTLALATLGLVRIGTDLVEFLIPVTILATAVFTIWQIHREERRRTLAPSGRMDRLRYALVLGFGLVHGLGFSTFLRSVLGAEDRLLVPLLAFNVGLELAQIAVLGLLLLFGALLRRVRFSASAWGYVVSGAAAGVALTMLVDRWPGA